MDEVWEYAVGIILTIIFYVIPWLSKQFKSKAEEPAEEWTDEFDEVWQEDLEEQEEPAALYPAGSPGATREALAQEPPRKDPHAAERAEFLARLTALTTTAQVISRDARQARATAPFSGPIDDYVLPQARLLNAEMARQPGPVDPALYEVASGLELVMAQLEVFIGQRRNPVLLPMLGDADALALNCYRPAIEFARARGLNLSSARPATQIGGGYDLAIWTGFIPTGLAPIFLPGGFFDNIMFWPAIAHEIGHDFLAATAGAGPLLRQQLGLVDEDRGTRPLNFSMGVTPQELRRLFGGWFEEIFCDVFGTMMLGPAYGISMAALFSAPDNPAETVLVSGDGTGARYDLHPPRHLRLQICAQVLQLVGQRADATELRELWSGLHGGELPEVYLFPHGSQYMALPTEPIEEIAEKLVERLYGEQLHAFSGFRLQDIPGVDYGPAEDARVRRAQEQLQGGQAPSTGSARAIIAAGVIATRAEPERQAEFLDLVRRAIPAEGTAEHSADAYDMPTSSALPAGFSEDDPMELRQAFILHTLLARPRLAGGGRPRRRGFLVRAR